MRESVVISDPDKAAMLLIALGGKTDGRKVVFTPLEESGFKRLEIYSLVASLQALADDSVRVVDAL